MTMISGPVGDFQVTSPLHTQAQNIRNNQAFGAEKVDNLGRDILVRQNGRCRKLNYIFDSIKISFFEMSFA